MKGLYIDGLFGQTHLSTWGEPSKHPILICLPPAPFSGLAFATLAPKLCQQRQVMAVDYPGYGNSSPGPNRPTINDYAKAVLAAINSVSPERKISLLGFHTGCLVAVEIATLAPHVISQLVLVDVPYFMPDQQAQLLAQKPSPSELSDELDQFTQAWVFCVDKLAGHVPITRRVELFVDHVSSGTRVNNAFVAAFSYPCKPVFEGLQSRCTLIATQAGLFNETRSASEAIAQAQLVEMPEITMSVLEKNATPLAAKIHSILAGVQTSRPHQTHSHSGA